MSAFAISWYGPTNDTQAGGIAYFVSRWLPSLRFNDPRNSMYL